MSLYPDMTLPLQKREEQQREALGHPSFVRDERLIEAALDVCNKFDVADEMDAIFRLQPGGMELWRAVNELRRALVTCGRQPNNPTPMTPHYARGSE